MDPLNSLKNKIIELKKIRDRLNSEITIETQTVTQLEEKLSAIQRELDGHKQSVSEKSRKLKGLNDKITCSESAISKLVSNTDKLNSVLDEELKNTH